VIFLPQATDKFLFVRVSSLRVAQLIRGCTPRVTVSLKPTSTAQREVIAGKVSESARP
jgi:DNA-directed RNA polymerase subunit K/omega